MTMSEKGCGMAKHKTYCPVIDHWGIMSTFTHFNIYKYGKKSVLIALSEVLPWFI